jgi:DNA-binding transcriptional LysR family regulator
MLDHISLDQLRALIAAADEGSFSAAARRLGRAQSVVSGLISSFEKQIGVTLFDRSGRFPKLTSQGTVILADARNIAAGIDLMTTRAQGMVSGQEHELSLVVSLLLPMSIITETAEEFLQKFPNTPVRLYVEALGGAYQRLTEKTVGLGILAPPAVAMPTYTFERLTAVSMIRVVAKEHPLAKFKGSIPRSEFAKYIRLVFADRSIVSRGQKIDGMIWRLADLFAKHAFLLQGVGWGSMPYHVVKDDIASGKLVVLHFEDEPAAGTLFSLSAVYPASTPPGTAGRWFIERLRAGFEKFDGLQPKHTVKRVAGKKPRSR